MSPAEFEALKNACVRVAQEAYEDARQSGLCAEGAFEAAISAIRALKLKPDPSVEPASRGD